MYFKYVQLTVRQSYLGEAVNGKYSAAQYGTGCTRILPKSAHVSNETSFPKGETRCPTDYSSAKILIPLGPPEARQKGRAPGQLPLTAGSPPHSLVLAPFPFSSRDTKKTGSKRL